MSCEKCQGEIEDLEADIEILKREVEDLKEEKEGIEKDLEHAQAGWREACNSLEEVNELVAQAWQNCPEP